MQRYNAHTCFSATVVVKHYGNNQTIKFKRLAWPVVAKWFITASTSIGGSIEHAYEQDHLSVLLPLSFGGKS